MYDRPYARAAEHLGSKYNPFDKTPLEYPYNLCLLTFFSL